MKSPHGESGGTRLNRRFERALVFVGAADLHGMKLQTQFSRRLLVFFPCLRRPGSCGFHSNATRESFGMVSLSNSSRLPANTGAMVVNPVTFPPGRARLSTNPAETGSDRLKQTMGIVLVAFLAARASLTPGVTITSTLRRTSSSAKPGAGPAYRPRTETQKLCSCLQHSRVYGTLARITRSRRLKLNGLQGSQS